MIFKAQDLLNHNANVALKVPHLEYESDPGFFTRFRREEEIGLKLESSVHSEIHSRVRGRRAGRTS